MPKIESLRVFMCHASSDKADVRKLYERLVADGIDAWLDEKKLLPGQEWQVEIPKAVRNSDAVLVCLSPVSVSKTGFVQKEIRCALDVADEKPEGSIYIIPARLKECGVPDRLRKFQWLNLFEANGYEQLLAALRQCASALHKPTAAPVGRDAVTVKAGHRERPTVWVLGSYRGLNEQEQALTRKLILTLGSSLAAKRVRLVSGRSDMLQDLSGYYRKVALSLKPRGSMPVMIEGKLRQTDLRELFLDTIRRIPNLAIVIGGSVGHRVAEECDYAARASIPVLPVPATGGSAARAKLTAERAQDLFDNLVGSDGTVDTNDLVAALLEAAERYA